MARAKRQRVSPSICKTNTPSAMAWSMRAMPKHAGFEAVWQAESRLVRDAIVPMAAFAAVTERIKVGSGVINNWTRNIGLLAATFLTLDDLAPNRVICGIGAWWDPLAKNVGIERRKPLRRHARDD